MARIDTKRAVPKEMVHIEEEAVELRNPLVAVYSKDERWKFFNDKWSVRDFIEAMSMLPAYYIQNIYSMSHQKHGTDVVEASLVNLISGVRTLLQYVNEIGIESYDQPTAKLVGDLSTMLEGFFSEISKTYSQEEITVRVEGN